MFCALGCGAAPAPIDASAPEIDAGSDAGSDAGPLAICGDGYVEPTESCDDGARTDGDACDASCRWTSSCGDGRLDGAEACDDANLVPGDGCSSLCTVESCGDGVIDYGELCDGGAGCSACTLPACGDGAIGEGESCDDGNADRYDGCGPDCTAENALVMSAFSVLGSDRGCDFGGDGLGDNAIAVAMRAVRGPFNRFVSGSIVGSYSLSAFELLGLDPARFAESDDGAIAIDEAADGNDILGDELTGDGELLVDSRSLRADGWPRYALTAHVRAGALTTDPGDVQVALYLLREAPIGRYVVVLRRATLTATLETSAGELTGLRDGVLCGVMPVASMAAIPDPTMFIVGASLLRSCTPDHDVTFLDQTAGGISILGLATRPTQPDVDLDGDGLEQLILDDMGPSGCQPVVAGCIDGDGSVLMGGDCVLSPRIADGYSAAVEVAGLRARLVGVIERAP